MKPTALLLGAACALCACRERPAKPGPPVSWHGRIEAPFAVHAVPGGTLVYSDENGVAGMRNGVEVWRVPSGRGGGWLVPVGDCLLTDVDEGVFCLAPEDGRVVWKTLLSDEGEPYAIAAAHRDGKTVVIGSDARFYRIDAAACAALRDGCSTPSGRLKEVTGDLELALFPDGTRATAMENWLILSDSNGERIGALAAGRDDFMGTPAIRSDGTLDVAYGSKLARIRPERCRVAYDEKIALDDRTVERVPPPAGCVEVLATIEDVDTTAPVVVGDDVIVTAMREMIRKGRKRWISSVDVAGNAIADGSTIYVPCWRATDNMFIEHVDLCAVDAESGHTIWRSRLGLPSAGLFDSPFVVDGKDWLYVHVKNRVAALRKPAG